MSLGDWGGQRAVSGLVDSEAQPVFPVGRHLGPVPKVDNSVWLLPLPVHRAHVYHACNLGEPPVPQLKWTQECSGMCVWTEEGASARASGGHGGDLPQAFAPPSLPSPQPHQSTHAHPPPGTGSLCGPDSPSSSGTLFNKQTFLYGVVGLLETGEKTAEAQQEEVAAAHSRGFGSTGYAS